MLTTFSLNMLLDTAILGSEVTDENGDVFYNDAVVYVPNGFGSFVPVQGFYQDEDGDVFLLTEDTPVADGYEDDAEVEELDE